MAYQSLDLGTSADDGTGDSLRVGGDKINDNFSEIYTLLGTGTALTSGLSATATVVTLSSAVGTFTTLTPAAADGTALGSASLEWSDLFLADGAVINLGADQDVTLTHVADTGILLNSTRQLQFGDSGTYIHQSADGVLDLVSDTELELNATTIDINGAVDISGATTVGGILKTDDTTEATSTTDGSLQTDGGLSVAKDVVAGDDVKLLSDAAVLAFGADGDVTLTHVADTGILLNSTMAIQFNDASQSINAPSNAILDINATDEIELNATLLDVNANINASGTYTGAGLMTTGGNIVIPDAGNIGSASDTDTISIASDGAIVMSGASVTVSGALGVAGLCSFSSDLELDHDGAFISFGANDEIKLTHVHDVGLTLKHTATADDKPIVLTLQTGETDIAVNDVIGTINFQAPDESTGTDAILVAAGIEAVSEGDFSSSNNATKLSFKTAASEAASEKMSLSSAGLLTVSGRLITDDTTEATSTTDGSLQTDGGLSVVKDAVFGDDIKLLSDSAVIHLGADSDVTITHDPDDGLFLKSTATGDNNPFLLTLQTGETDIAANDVLGKIQFQAPDEGTGTDAVLVAAAIEAVSVGDFSSSSNATNLNFMTGASEEATTKLTLESDGDLHLRTDGKSLMFGADAEILLTHVHDSGIRLSDAIKFLFGTDNDFAILHDGSSAYLQNSTGNLNLQAKSGESSIVAAPDGAVTLYHDNSYRLVTNSTGVTISDAQQTAATSGAALSVLRSGSNLRVAHFENTRNTSGDETVRLTIGSNCSNTSSFFIIGTANGVGDVLNVFGNGNITNQGNSYGQNSDVKIKKNIVDATNKLDDLCKVRVRNFVMKQDPTELKQIGVVAQEVEEIFPGIIDETPDRDSDDQPTGTVTKSVKYSVFVPMLIKGIQELRAKNDALEDRIEILESAIEMTIEGQLLDGTNASSTNAGSKVKLG